MNSATKYEPLVRSTAQKYNIPEQTFVNMLHTETGGTVDPATAVSPAGAQGVMQLMPKTAKGLGLKEGEAFIPEKNVEAAGRLYKGLLNKYGDTGLAAMAYNWGEGNLDQQGALYAPKETRDYYHKVTKGQTHKSEQPSTIADSSYSEVLAELQNNLSQQKAINEVNLQEAQARLKNTQDSYAADAANKAKEFELSQESLAGRAALEKQLMIDSWNKQKQRNRFNSALAESEADVAQMLKPKQVQLLGVKAGKLV